MPSLPLSALRGVVAVVAALLLGACGSSAPLASPTTSLLDPLQPRTDPLVAITSKRVSPQDSHLDHPVTVKFVNQDSMPHTMTSAPELGNGDCPEMAEIGRIEPGQSRSTTITSAAYAAAFLLGFSKTFERSRRLRRTGSLP